MTIFRKYLMSYLVAMAMSSMSNCVNADWQNLNGLLCHYKGDSSLDDSSDSGHNLSSINGGPHYETVQSTPFSSTPRAVFALNGSSGNGYHLKAVVPSLPLNNSPRTVMGWVRIDQDGTGGWASPFAYGGGGHYKDFVLSFPPSATTTKIDVYGPYETNDGLIESARSYGTWKHYAITYDGTNLLVYVSGTLTYQGTIDAALQTGNTGFFIGARLTGDGAHFYGAAAEIAVFNRALTQSEVDIVVGTDTAGGGGDPHFLGFGGILFTWQGHCDIILAKSPKVSKTDKELEIHVRTRKVRQWSTIDSIAIRVGQDIGEIRSDEGVLVLNGKEEESVQTESVAVTKTVTKSFSKLNKMIVEYDFVFDNNKMLQVRVNTRTNMIYTTLNGNFPKETVGILGSPHHPGQFARNGTPMAGKDVNEFVQSWQVRDTDAQLFHERRHPQFPSKCLYNMSEIKSSIASRHLREVHTVTYEEAHAACSVHHPGLLKDFCIDDIFATGDLDSAKDTFYG